MFPTSVSKFFVRYTRFQKKMKLLDVCRAAFRVKQQLNFIAGREILIKFSCFFITSDKMSATLKPYLTVVRNTLTGAMCLDNFSSQVIRILIF